ncbi:MAG: serine/threonine protein kinase bacterial [Erysipelotrichaceae bacterium]|nr:MAG: serine/threonine protein kinase [Erysipelotrichaceae bacterium]TXT19045.1 MAG: serine/threonine protein kinase bacterial [Erysipelotrichaceae bacterium]
MKEMIANRYVINKKLGEGGMADVYLAQDSFLNREVAVKILRGKLSLDPVALLRFQREANAASRLNHPNIVEIYDVGEDNGQHYIVMEYIRGKSLKELISQRGAMEKQEALQTMDQLLCAITEAHKNNIIHRDIKPQNIMVKDDGTVKVADFGIATVSDAVQLTQTDTVMGSVHYLAPELARGENASFQSDIYALGITFYELVTGRVPFTGEAAVQVAMKHMREEVPSVRDFNPSIPQSMENVIIKATAKNKTHRYKMASDMYEDLMNCLKDKNKDVAKVVFTSDTLNDDTIIIQQVANMSPQKPKRKIGILSALIGLIFIALVGMSVYAFILISGFLNPETEFITIPNVSAMTRSDAEDAITALGLAVSNTVRYELTDDIATGLVVKVTPSSGQKLERGSVVILTLSKGMYFVIGNYVNQKIDAVELLLASTKVTIRKQFDYDSDKDEGTIIKQENLLEGEKIDPAMSYEIKLTIAGKVQFTIPNLVGINVQIAQTQLTALGAIVELQVLSTSGMTAEQIAVLPKNQVISITPGANTYYIQKTDSKIILSYYANAAS